MRKNQIVCLVACLAAFAAGCDSGGSDEPTTGTATVAGVATGTTESDANSSASSTADSSTTETTTDTTTSTTADGTVTTTSGRTVLAPTISATTPADGEIGVFTNRQIAVTLNEAMDPATINASTFIVMQGTTLVPGTVTIAGSVALFTPTSDLIASSIYTVTITTGAKDLAGNALAVDTVWSFTTGATADTVVPTITVLNPVNADTHVAVNQKISVTFSEAMDVLTMTTEHFVVTGPGSALIAGVVDYDALVNRAIFTASKNFAPNTLFTATINTGAKDLAGNALASDVVWSFTTSAVAGPAPLVLGSAGTFAILTKSGITDVPSSVITGDIGASPITGAALIISCPEVTGTIYSVDATGPACKVTDDTFLTTAVGDMEIAFTDAAGRTLPDFTEHGAGEIGGLTLVPGLYKWSTSVLISTDVTLSGGADDVWIFQISGDLTQANGKIVHLAGGAQAKNIYWQVGGGTGVAIGTTAHFEGTILALKGINLATGATVNGRLLAQTAVALDHNTVTKPAP